MRKTIFIAILIISIISCKKEEIIIDKPVMDYVSFQGTWTRDFDAAGNEHTAKYTITENSIHYELEGVVGFADYVINKDSYNEADGRWIGHTDKNKYYLLFFKGVLKDEITMYKQKVDDPNEAQNIEIPADDYEENYGWNTYDRKN